MNDLRSQLISKLGAAPPAPASATPIADDGLDPFAHLQTPWFALVRTARVAGGPEVPPKPSLPAARQITDKLAKALKATGRPREAAALIEAREDFLKRREKQAWSLIKARFTDLDLPERAYRALKQSEVDPEKVWAKLRKADTTELKGMGADRLREWLL